MMKSITLNIELNIWLYSHRTLVNAHTAHTIKDNLYILCPPDNPSRSLMMKADRTEKLEIVA